MHAKVNSKTKLGCTQQNIQKRKEKTESLLVFDMDVVSGRVIIRKIADAGK